jgi:hypothetical protein
MRLGHGEYQFEGPEQQNTRQVLAQLSKEPVRVLIGQVAASQEAVDVDIDHHLLERGQQQSSTTQ